MAENRSVELEIRAQDYSGKTINDVRKNIKGLKDDLNEQAKSAAKGKADFKAYEASLKGLASAATKLTELQTMLGKLSKLADNVASSAERAKDASDAYDDFANKISALGVPTKAQADKLARLEANQLKAAEAAKKQADAYERQRLEAEAHGLATNNIQRAQEGLTKTYERTLQTIIDMRNAQAALQRQNEITSRSADRRKELQEQIRLQQEALKLAQQQAAAEAARRRNVQSQRNQINAQRVSIAQQIAEARAAQQPSVSDAVSRALNPSRDHKNAMADITTSVRNASTTMRKSATDVKALSDAMDKLRAAQEKLKVVAGNIDLYRKQSAELAKLRTAYETTRVEHAKLNSKVASGNATTQEIAKLRQLVAQLNQSGAAFARQKIAVEQTARILGEAGVNVDKLTKAEQRLAANAARTAAASKALDSQIKNLSDSTESTADAFDRWLKGKQGILVFLQQARGKVLALSAALGGLYLALDKVVKDGQEGVTLKIRAEVLADNWDTTAGELEKYFRDTAERMGLELGTIIQDSAKLFVAGKEAKLDSKTVKYIFEQFSGFGQLMGADAETQSGIYKALEQMLSKTTVQAEELKGQLADRLPAATNLFAKALGVSNAELMTMMKDGKVLAADVLPKVAALIEQTYGSNIEKTQKSLVAEQSRLNNAFKDWIRIIADAGVMDNFTALLREVRDFFRSDEAKQWAEAIATALNVAIEALRWAVKHANELVIAFGALLAIGAAQMFVSLAATMRTFGLGLKTAGAAITNFAVKMGLIAKVAPSVGSGLGGAASAGGRLGLLVAPISRLIGVLASAAKIAFGLFKAFIVFELVEAIFDGIVRGINRLSGESEDAVSGMQMLSDVLWLISEAFGLISEAIGVVIKGIGDLVADATEWIGSFFVDTAKESNKSAKEFESGWTGAVRYIARMIDALTAAFKTTFLYLGGLADYVIKKFKGIEAALPDADQISMDVSLEVNENGVEAKLNKRLEEMRKKVNETDSDITQKTALDAANRAAADAAKKAEEAKNLDEKVNKAREKAEQARQRAEEAALRRLEKELSYEKMIQKLIDYREGRLKDDPMKGYNNLGDWYLGERQKVKSKYAANDPYENYSSGSTGTSSYAVDKRAAAAADLATKRAAATFTKQCATYVKRALAAVDPQAAPYIKGNGNVTAKNLLKYGKGWQQIPYSANYVPQKGDVVSWGAIKGHKYGHTSIYNGNEWVSDTKQGKYGIDAKTGASSRAYLAEMARNPNYKPTIVRLTGGNSVTITGSTGSVSHNTAADSKVLDFYKAQEERWKQDKAVTKQQKDDDAAFDKAESLVEKVTESARDAIREMYKAMGVNGVEGLINRDPSTLSVDLSGSTLNEIIDGFKNIIQPDTDNQVKQMLEALTLDYAQSKNVSRKEAFAWSKQLEPQLAKYAELQAQKALGEQVDAFLDALEKKRNDIEKERANSAEYIGSAVSRGVLTIDEAQAKMSESTLKYVERMTDAIKKLDEIINSDAFNKLSPEQQAAILNQREQLGVDQADYATNPRRQAANAAVDSMAKRLDDFLQRKRQFEELQEQLVISGQQSITKMEENVQAYLNNIAPQMKELVANAQQIMAAFGDSASYANLTNLATKIKDVGTETTHTKGEAELMKVTYETLSNGAMTAFDAMAQGLAGIATGAMSSREAFANLGQAMAQWAADALRQIAKLIVQQLISLAIQKAMSSFFGGASVQMPDLSGFMQYANLFHTGGIVGGGKGGGKKLNPLVFQGAVRYHSGGIVGLAPDEVPAVLQKGEEVITKDDPRHRNNMNQSSSNGSPLTVINSFDPKEALAHALKSSGGRKILIQAAGRERKAFGRL
jgi:tape measure domain-containing protein|nr:MAG TPA_asm: tail tape measure [Caudoviricetes sp.]